MIRTLIPSLRASASPRETPITLSGVFLLILTLCASASLCGTTTAAEPLRIHWIDVEGGAATLIVTPAGESILIDTGMPGLRDPVRIHRHCRDIAKIEKIDHLVVTHFDLDHYGGAADLAKLIPIGKLYDHNFKGQENNMKNALRPSPHRASFTIGPPPDRLPCANPVCSKIAAMPTTM